MRRLWIALLAVGALLVAGVGVATVAEGRPPCGHKFSAPCPPPTTTTTVAPPTTTTTVAPTTTTSTVPPTTTTTQPQPGTVLSGEQAGFTGSYQVLFDSDADLAHHLDLIAATGAKWVRGDFYWSTLNPSPGVYDWSTTDRFVAAANARGLHVLANPAYTPSWARPGCGDDKCPPADMQTYANFVAAAAARYAPLGVHHWEIWNEPNVPQFWKPAPSPSQYALMLRAAYVAIHNVDPSATVLTGGTATAGASLDSMGGDGVSYSPYRWLRLLYEGGNQSFFDGVATHPYATFPYSPLEQWNSTWWTDDMHALMAAHGDDAKKLWGTEAGYPSCSVSGYCVNESTQAQYIHDYLTVWRDWSAWTGPLFIYQMRDRGTSLSDPESNFGLVHNNWSPKPSYGVFDQDVG